MYSHVCVSGREMVLRGWEEMTSLRNRGSYSVNQVSSKLINHCRTSTSFLPVSFPYSASFLTPFSSTSVTIVFRLSVPLSLQSISTKTWRPCFKSVMAQFSPHSNCSLGALNLIFMSAMVSIQFSKRLQNILFWLKNQHNVLMLVD